MNDQVTTLGHSAGYGISQEQRHKVLRNTFLENGDGLELTRGAAFNLIADNVFDGGADNLEPSQGIEILWGNDNTVVRNRFVRYSDGLQSNWGARNYIGANVFEDNAFGISLTGAGNLYAYTPTPTVTAVSPSVAASIVRWRDAHGAFRNRQQLLDVTGLGPKTFEQAAGFLRIREGDNPLDFSGVHPETYPLVERIAANTGRDIRSLIGDAGTLKRLDPKQFTDEQFGLTTVSDILVELEKPGRDPRPEFKTAEFQEGVESLKDLKLGMQLEGVVTNVTNFGAFVDIGVHQDGLVHISALSEKFVKDPYEVVKAGDIVRVKVMEVDIPRNRVALSMRMGDTPGEKIEGPRGGARGSKPGSNTPRSERHSSQDKPAPANACMAALFANAKNLRK